MFKKFVTAEILTLSIFLLAVFIFGVAISYLGFSKTTPRPEANQPRTKNSFSSAIPKAINNTEKGIYNVLFLGYGGAGHDGALLTDSIIIIHVDTNSHKADMISIPRDLWAPGNQKINAIGAT